MGSAGEVKRVAGLLRAVNVGGRKVLMADLKRVAADAGFDRPQTLLASGNIVFGTDLEPRAAGERLEAAILKEIGVATDVMVRDHAELARVMAANPFPQQAKDAPGRLAVVFLSGEPAGDLESLKANCTLGEDVRLGPGCLYIWFPQGMGVSKLSNAVLERRLKVRGTARNWNTVGKLTDLLRD
jgi:uncharacterized protein (DUF1697 family)